MIYVSSVAFSKPKLENILPLSKIFNFELSANIVYESNVDGILSEFSNQFLVHNYFPRPEKDFVLNLASGNEYIRNSTIEFAVNNIRRCEKFNIPFYSIHSGFRFDPAAAQLGNTFKHEELTDYNLALELFSDSISSVLERTSGSKVMLLLENNVITIDNLKSFGQNPLLCCDHSDFVKIFKTIDDKRLGVLTDFGHIKVSANTLGFDRTEFYNILRDKIFAHHLSDNDSLYDTNKPFTDASELKEIKSISESTHIVLEVNNLTTEEITGQIDLLSQILL